jgi:DNA polymerase/3'-5' exonuclease PolX
VFREVLNSLKKCGLLIETFSKGRIKSLTMGRIRDYPARRLDFMYTPPKEYAFAILYFTGSKAFNVSMRGYALNMGYTMNEHGFHKVNGEKVEKIFTSEKAIFDFLSLEYKTPEKRVDGNAIIVIKNVESMVNFLSKKYNFDVEEAMKYLETC